MIFFNRQCSECDPSSDDEEMEVDPEDTTPISQGRQRRIIKEPTKFTPDKGEVRQIFKCVMKVYACRRRHDGPKKNEIKARKWERLVCFHGVGDMKSLSTFKIFPSQ